MADLSSFGKRGTYHVLAFGTLLGGQIFQTFVGGIVAYKALPRPQFSSLQKAVFPIYFAGQTALPIALALTYPGSEVLGTANGFSGTFENGNRWGVLVPLATIFTTSLLNLAIIGPATTKIMRERKHQETRDGKKSYDPAPHSKEMQKLNRAFGKMHGVSSLLNLVTLVATFWYGATIAERIV